MMNDSFGRILKGQSIAALDLFGASLKMSQDTYPGLSPMYLRAYELWVTQLSRDCLQRKKLVRHMSANGCLSSPLKKNWTTPVLMDTEESVQAHAKRAKRLKERHKGKTGNGCGMSLGTQVKKWPTPTASEAEKACKGQNQESLVKMSKSGQLYQSNHNTNGKNPGQCSQNDPLKCSIATYKSILRAYRKGKRKSIPVMELPEELNPAWVAQLMGTSLEQSFFVNTVTEWSGNKQH